MVNSEFDPMDEEERILMEAIEHGGTRPVPREELEATPKPKFVGQLTT